MARAQRVRKANRRLGAAMVEFAIGAWIFFLITLAMVEFGRCYMVIQVLNGAARVGGRTGVVDNTNTAGMIATMLDFCDAGGVDRSKVRVFVLDGSAFDENANSPPTVSSMTGSYTSPFEVSSAKPRQLFIVRLEVTFRDVAMWPPRWIPDVTLFGQGVMRHE